MALASLPSALNSKVQALEFKDAASLVDHFFNHPDEKRVPSIHAFKKRSDLLSAVQTALLAKVNELIYAQPLAGILAVERQINNLRYSPVLLSVFEEKMFEEVAAFLEDVKLKLILDAKEDYSAAEYSLLTARLAAELNANKTLRPSREVEAAVEAVCEEYKAVSVTEKRGMSIVIGANRQLFNIIYCAAVQEHYLDEAKLRVKAITLGMESKSMKSERQNAAEALLSGKWTKSLFDSTLCGIDGAIEVFEKEKTAAWAPVATSTTKSMPESLTFRLKNRTQKLLTMLPMNVESFYTAPLPVKVPVQKSKPQPLVSAAATSSRWTLEGEFKAPSVKAPVEKSKLLPLVSAAATSSRQAPENEFKALLQQPRVADEKGKTMAYADKIKLFTKMARNKLQGLVDSGYHCAAYELFQQMRASKLGQIISLSPPINSDDVGVKELATFVNKRIYINNEEEGYSTPVDPEGPQTPSARP